MRIYTSRNSLSSLNPTSNASHVTMDTDGHLDLFNWPNLVSSTEVEKLNGIGDEPIISQLNGKQDDLDVPSQAEAEAGTATDERVWTAERIKQAIDALGGAGGGASELSDLSDVNTSTVTNRNVLVADGTDFESRALVEADISDLGTYATAKEYASFYLSTGGVTAVAATETTLTINATSVNSDTDIFELASSQVTVNKTADFKITGDVSFNSGGSSRSEYNVWLEQESTDVPGSRTANYQRGYDSGSTSTFTIIVSVTSGDVFQLRTMRTDGAGTTGYQDDNGTRLTFEEK